MATTPPGWYDDGHGALRWWDGAQWTEHTHVADAAPAVDAVVSDAVVSDGFVADAAALGAVVPDAAAPAPVSAAASPPPPSGYAAAPLAYPGDPASAGGVFVGATEPRKSMLWILWVVLGVVVLGLVVLAFVLIPLVVGLVSNAASGGTSGATADENASVAAVRLYDEAWDTGDCDKFMTATTGSFRTLIEIEDCATFRSASSDFTEATDNYELVVDDVQTSGSTITVETTETYDSLYDASGTLLDEPESAEEHYAYRVIRDADLWAIDAADTVTN
jgi:hypothetical protein